MDSAIDGEDLQFGVALAVSSDAALVRLVFVSKGVDFFASAVCDDPG